MKTSGVTVAVIQARMGSTRLPGKVLLPLGEKCLLRWVVDRARQAKNLDQVAVATSTNPADDVLADLCRSWGVPCYRGSEADVLGRFVAAAAEFAATIIVRINADNPLLAPEYIAPLVESIENGADYASYRRADGTPVMLTSLSFFAEAISRNCLDRAHHDIADPFQREHVTLGIYTRPEHFKLCWLDVPIFCEDNPLRFTVDTQTDLDMLREICATPGSDLTRASAAEVVHLVAQHPRWMSIMAAMNARHSKNVTPLPTPINE